MTPGRRSNRRRFDAGGWSALLRPEPKSSTVDVALIAVRIALAWIFVYYGAQKLFGAFNGPGLHGTALYFSHTAHLRPGELFAVVGGVIEFGGGIAIALGLLSRLAALALFGDQVIAMITVTWANGFGSLSGRAGYPFNMALAVLALVAIVLGPGRASIDHLVARRLRAVRPSSRFPLAASAEDAPMDLSPAPPPLAHPDQRR